jgi:hypothetical protein
MSQIKITINNLSGTADNVFRLNPYSGDKHLVANRLVRMLGSMSADVEAKTMTIYVDGGVGAAQASGTLTASSVVAGDSVQVGDQVFVASASPVGPNQFPVGGSTAASMANLAAAINANPAFATASGTTLVTATAVGSVVTVNANAYGNNGNMIQLVGSTATPSALGVASTYAVIGASAVTNTGSSVLTGNLGIYPNNASSITGFPPGTYSGTENAGNAAAAAAQAAAQATYTTMNAMTATAISSTLDGQTLAPGVYKESSGHFNLAASGAGTLTLNGAGTYIFQCSSTLTTGAGGVPTITLSGGAKASNVYWIVGSSATINAGSAGTFQGNIIAQASVTDTLGGTVNGTMVALTGAVTMSAATTANAQPASGADVIASAPYLLGGVEPALNQYVYAGLI